MVFDSGLEDQGFNPRSSQTQKMVFDSGLEDQGFNPRSDQPQKMVFDFGLKDQGFNPRSSQTQKMVFDSALLYTRHYKVRIKGKVEESRERSSTLLCTSV